MNHKIILFGAGFFGRCAYEVLHDRKEILCFIDNDEKKRETSTYGVPIIGLEEAKDRYDLNVVSVVVCAQKYLEIGDQLRKTGVNKYFVFLGGFIYRCSDKEMMTPVEVSDYSPFENEDEKLSVLYVQDTPCIRTNKIATIMKEMGWHVSVLFTMLKSDEKSTGRDSIYDDSFYFSSMQGIIDFIDQSDYNIVHCSNAPDILSVIAMQTNKPVIHDTHDMHSIWLECNPERMMIEFIANTNADGNVYTSDLVVDIAKNKYNLKGHEVLSLPNYILEYDGIDEPYTKLSEEDGEIHCVYEGTISDSPSSDRFFEEIWEIIGRERIHVHFYTHGNPYYCEALEKKSPYIHYEGNLNSKDLLREMTKYDVGLLLFNLTDQNRLFMNTGTANKLYEYIASGLPVVVGDLPAYREFVEKYGVGIVLDYSKSIEQQLKEVKNIEIPKNFLNTYKFTMKTQGVQIDEFYKKVISMKKGKR